MNNVTTWIASGHLHKRLAMHPSVRSQLTGTGAVILALGLVAAPPEPIGARTEARAVQLASTALSPAPSSGALLKQFIKHQAQFVALVAPLVSGGGTDITTTDVASRTGNVTAPITFQSTTDPARSSQVTDNATLAATPGGVGTDLPTLLAQLILAPFVLAFFGALLLVAAIQSFFYNSACCAATVASEPMLSESAPTTLAKVGPADEAQVSDTDQATLREEKKSSETDNTSSTDKKSTDKKSTEKKRATENDQAGSNQRSAGIKGATSSKQRDDNDQSTKRAEKSAAGHSSS